MSPTCIFCEIASRRASADVVCEDEQNAAFLPLQQEVFGHILIIPKTHRATLRDITSTELTSLTKFVQKTAALYAERLGSGDFNLLLASGIAAQQSVPHLHFHYFPRFTEDGLNTWPRLPDLPPNGRSDFLKRFSREG
jgi:histidine triad (HIT) family protein